MRTRWILLLLLLAMRAFSMRGAHAAPEEWAELSDSSFLYKLPVESRGPIDGQTEALGPGTAVRVERRSAKLPWAFVRVGAQSGWVPLARLTRFENREPVVAKVRAVPAARRARETISPVESEKLLKQLREESL